MSPTTTGEAMPIAEMTALIMAVTVLVIIMKI